MQVEPQIKSGNLTTEYARTQSASWWGIIGLVLGLVVAVGPDILAFLSGPQGVVEGSNIHVVLGSAISVASLLYKTLVDVGYVKSRTEVKSQGIKAAKVMVGGSK